MKFCKINFSFREELFMVKIGKHIIALQKGDRDNISKLCRGTNAYYDYHTMIHESGKYQMYYFDENHWKYEDLLNFSSKPVREMSPGLGKFKGIGYEGYN